MASTAKHIIARLAYALRFWQGVAWLCGRISGRPLLAAFTFHRVVGDPPPDTHLLGYERGQSVSSFEAQLEAIGRVFDLISLSEFSELAAGRKAARQRPVALLTFDDADSLHDRFAFPALAQRGWPGVSFVPTGFIESTRRFYHLRLTNLCNHLSASDWGNLLNDPVPPEVQTILQGFLNSDGADRRALRRQLIPPFHAMGVHARDRLLDSWERLVPAYTLGIGCADWAVIRSWESKQIAIGSHSVNHNRFALLDTDAIRFELAASRQDLLGRLQGGVISVSYPEGSYTVDVPDLAEEAGYELGFTTDTGFVSVPLRDRQRYLIPRISLDGDTPSLAAYSLGRSLLRHLIRTLGRLGKGAADQDGSSG